MGNASIQIRMLRELTDFIVDSIKSAEVIDERAFKAISAELEMFINILMDTGFSAAEFDRNPEILWTVLLCRAKMITALELARAKFKAMIAGEVEKTKQKKIEAVCKSIETIKKTVFDTCIKPTS